ncbi:MAG: hypothetical protein V3U23_01345 [Kiloniellales bacterium]
MDSRLWLAIAAVSAVTAVILARRKNRSAVIWPVASFVFPPALLPLFALAPLAEKNTGQLDRRFVMATVSALVLLVVIALLRYGSLHPCDMVAYEAANEVVAYGGNPGSRQKLEEMLKTYSSPERCLARMFEFYL